MTNLKYLYVYPAGPPMEIQTLFDYFDANYNGTSTVDIVDVAEYARATYLGFNPDTVVRAYNQWLEDEGYSSDPVAPVRVLDQTRRGDYKSPRLVLEAADDCADEWREFTKYIEGLTLVVNTVAADGRGDASSYRYWEGKRQLLHYAKRAAA